MLQKQNPSPFYLCMLGVMICFLFQRIQGLSYVAGGKQLLANALYTSGQVSANGLTSLAET
jgi:hypothetical protein